MGFLKATSTLYRGIGLRGDKKRLQEAKEKGIWLILVIHLK